MDLIAIGDLLLAGRGYEVAVGTEPLVELAGWVAHNPRRVAVHTAIKNQVLAQVDRCCPDSPLSVERAGQHGRTVVLAEFSDPTRLARPSAARFRAFAAKRDVLLSVTLAERFVAAARMRCPLLRPRPPGRC